MLLFDTQSLVQSIVLLFRLMIQTSFVINFVVVQTYYSLLQISYRYASVKSRAESEFVVVKA